MKRKRPVPVVPRVETILAECRWRGRRVVLRSIPAWHPPECPPLDVPDDVMLSMVAYEDADGKPFQYDPDELGTSIDRGNGKGWKNVEFLTEAMRAINTAPRRKGKRGAS